MQCNIQPILCLYLAVVTKRNTLMFSALFQSKLLTAFVLKSLEMQSSKRRSRDEFEQIMKHSGKTIHVECWNSIPVVNILRLCSGTTRHSPVTAVPVCSC